MNRSFVSNLEGAIDGEPLPARTVQTVHAGAADLGAV